MNIALLLSGGTGSRIKSDVPKQYICINRKMMITYALEILINASIINEVQVVAEHEWREIIVADCKQHGICMDKIKGFAIPGFSRQASILNGLQNIIQKKNGKMDINYIDEYDNVLIHDASRPFVTIQQINDCFAKMADGYDGVIPVLHGEDTVYLGDDKKNALEFIDKKIFAGQAPELFSLKKYYEANMALMPDKLKNVKNSVEPAIMAGMNLAMIPGDENNFNITIQTDLDRFARIVGLE